jgi:tripartite-type tricarboxylate transporter receptor subunit TctC
MAANEEKNQRRIRVFNAITFLRAGCAASLSALAMLAAAQTAAAQTPAEFYKGKTLEYYVGYGPGSAYDLYARMIARHIGKHIPGNPTVVSRNMDGAGSLRLANWLYNVAPKDGLAIGGTSRGMAFFPLLGGKGGQYDARKFTWIGSANDEVSLCVSWHTSGVTTIDDLKTKELATGSTGVADDTYQFPKILNGVLGTKFKPITGYESGNAVSLAMERGEVQGRCGWSWSSVKATKMDWYKNKTVHLLVQLSLNREAELPEVPLVTELAKTPEELQIFKMIFARQVMGRPYMAPPGIPKDRAEALQKAFMDTMKDPEFLAEAEKGNFEIKPVSGPAIEKLVSEVYATPPDVVAKATELVK